MSQKRKKIDAEFKREAIRLADQPGKKDRQVEKDLGIYQGALRHWRKELAKNLLHAFPGAGHQTPLEEENRRLKKALADVTMEREILKKLWPSFRNQRRPVPFHEGTSRRVFGGKDGQDT